MVKSFCNVRVSFIHRSCLHTSQFTAAVPARIRFLLSISGVTVSFISPVTTVFVANFTPWADLLVISSIPKLELLLEGLLKLTVCKFSPLNITLWAADVLKLYVEDIWLKFPFTSSVPADRYPSWLYWDWVTKFPSTCT